MVFLLIAGKIISQNPLPTYTDNPLWTMVYTGWFSSGCYTANVLLKPDTLICGKAYYPIIQCSNGKCRGTYAYFRQSADKVYMRYQWNACAEEYLVYDFNLNVGDTAFCLTDFGDSTKLWVVNKANVMYEGVPRLTLTMSCSYLNAYGNYIKWIYGVGSDIHPFLSLACIGPECEEDQQLVKATVNGVVTYKDTLWKFSCPYWVGIKENNSVSEVKIYPTLTREEINFESKGEAEFQVTNILGERALHGKAQSESGRLSVSALTPGLYFFTLKSDSSFYTARFIKE
jgi:hypothetical protein